jgi:hypothetical protein
VFLLNLTLCGWGLLEVGLRVRDRARTIRAVATGTALRGY